MLPKGLLKEYSRVITILTRAMDMIIVLFAGWFAYVIRFHEVTMSTNYLWAMVVGLLATTVVFSFFNIYISIRGQSFLRHVMTLLHGVLILGLVLASVAFFTKAGDSYSRLWFLGWIIFSFILLVFFRCSILLILRLMRARGLNERRVVIMGAGDLGVKFAQTVQVALWTGFRIVSFMDDEAEQKPRSFADIPVIQTPKNLGDYLDEADIDEIWLALPLHAEARVKEILFELRHHTINTRFVLNIFSLDLLNHSISDVAGFPVLNVRYTPMMGINRLVKAIEDRLLAFAILMIITPFLLFIALGVKLTSKGPIVFKQERLGWDGRIINIYKFRTMVEHHETIGAITQAKCDDPRITSFGKWLRRTSLDELPQFFNVLQGRMSIVGPRPHALPHNEMYKDTVRDYMQRHHVKPGITGWAQVNGWRGETDTLIKMQKRVEYDLYYINNWSLWFDIKIIFLTFLKGFLNRNAY